MPVFGPETCPHCGIDNMTFKSLDSYGFNRVEQKATTMFQCQKCERGVVVEFSGNMNGFDLWFRSQVPFSQCGIEVTGMWPEAQYTRAPLHTPDNIARFYVQGVESLARGHCDAAGMTFRKALDISVSALNPTANKRDNLKKRINTIPVESGVTPAMKEWAHIIRDDGNDAAHEEEPYTKDEATGLEAFTKLFLTYAFTLPGMVRERRGETDPQEPEA
jgi:hypothetical protein